MTLFEFKFSFKFFWLSLTAFSNFSFCFSSSPLGVKILCSVIVDKIVWLSKFDITSLLSPLGDILSSFISLFLSLSVLSVILLFKFRFLFSGSLIIFFFSFFDCINLIFFSSVIFLNFGSSFLSSSLFSLSVLLNSVLYSLADSFIILTYLLL
jgi:hypothetical protein